MAPVPQERVQHTSLVLRTQVIDYVASAHDWDAEKLLAPTGQVQAAMGGHVQSTCRCDQHIQYYQVLCAIVVGHHPLRSHHDALGEKSAYLLLPDLRHQ